MVRAPPLVGSITRLWERIWKCKLQDKLKLTLWKVVASAMKARGLLGGIFHMEDAESFLCPFCHQATEDSLHLFFRCSMACVVWRTFAWPVHMDSILLSNAAEMVGFLLNVGNDLNLDSSWVRAFVLNASIVLNVIWFTRNDVVHNSAFVDTRDMAKAIRQRYLEHSAT